MGYSRDTFYQVRKAYQEGGIEALKEESRRRPNIKNRVSEQVEDAVLQLAFEDPILGQKRVSDTLRQEIYVTLLTIVTNYQTKQTIIEAVRSGLVSWSHRDHVSTLLL